MTLHTLTKAVATTIVAATVLVGSFAQPASAGDWSLPSANAPTCGAMSGPAYAQELTYYVFAYRISGEGWTYSRWFASQGSTNWEYYYGSWATRTANHVFITQLDHRPRVEQWVYIVRSSYTGWVDLGVCS